MSVPYLHGLVVGIQMLARLLVVCAFGIGLTACGGSDATVNGTAKAVIDQAGGTLNGPDGIQIIVPAGALDHAVTITVTRNPVSAPSLTSTGLANSPIYEITPHGLQFSQPVTIRIPAPSGQDPQNPQILIAAQGGDWVRTLASISNGMLEVRRMTFSFFSFGGAYICTNQMTAADPYACYLQEIWRPTITVVSNTPFNQYTSSAFTDNSALLFDLLLAGAPDCNNGKLVVSRTNIPISGTSTTSVIAQVPVTIPPNGDSTHVLVGAANDANFQVTAANNGRIVFNFSYTCTRAIWGGPHTVAGELDWRVNITSPLPIAAAVATTDPADLTVTEGAGPAIFTVSPSGTGPFTYQWKRNGTAIAGETLQTYTLAIPTVANDSGAVFSVDVGSPWGSTVSSRNALLTVLSSSATSPIVVTINPPYAAYLSPTYPGSSKSYKLLASGGNPPYSYQWTLNGQNLPTSTAMGISAGGCDLNSVDFSEQATRIFMNHFGGNCATSALNIGVIVTDALGNVGTGILGQQIAASTNDLWQVRNLSQFDQIMNPVGIGNLAGSGTNAPTNVITDSAGNPVILTPIDGYTENLYKYSATYIPALSTGVVTANQAFAIDGSDTVYYGTYPNNTIYKLDTSGTFTLFAGVSHVVNTAYPPDPVDGAATTVATFSSIYQMDANRNSGEVYVLELLAIPPSGSVAQYKSWVRKIVSGNVTTIHKSDATGTLPIWSLAFDNAVGQQKLYLLGSDGTNQTLYTFANGVATPVTSWSAATYSLGKIVAGDGVVYGLGGDSSGNGIIFTIDGSGLHRIAGATTIGAIREGAASSIWLGGVNDLYYDIVNHSLIYPFYSGLYRLTTHP